MSSVATTSRKKGRAGCRVAGQWLGRCSMGVFYPRGHDGSRKAQVPGNPDRLCGEALWHGLTQQASASWHCFRAHWGQRVAVEGSASPQCPSPGFRETACGGQVQDVV